MTCTDLDTPSTFAYPMKAFPCPNGMRFWNSPDSGAETKFIYKEIFEQRCYQKHGVSVADGDTIFDVGANVGMFARSLIDRHDNLSIYCFEPVPNTRACLERNIDESPRRSNHRIEVLDVAVGERECQTTIDFFPHAPGNSTLYPEEKKQEFDTLAQEIRVADLWKTKKNVALLMLLLYPVKKQLLGLVSRKFLSKAEPIPCQVRTLSQLIREHDLQGVDLLKIDVEGAELDVIAGIEDDHWPLIGQIAMEVAPAHKPQISVLAARLSALGFVHVVTENMLGDDDAVDNPGPCTLYATRGGCAASTKND